MDGSCRGRKTCVKSVISDLETVSICKTAWVLQQQNFCNWYGSENCDSETCLSLTWEALALSVDDADLGQKLHKDLSAPKEAGSEGHMNKC